MTNREDYQQKPKKFQLQKSDPFWFWYVHICKSERRRDFCRTLTYFPQGYHSKWIHVFDLAPIFPGQEQTGLWAQRQMCYNHYTTRKYETQKQTHIFFWVVCFVEVCEGWK